jgi:hypothetical protein
MILKGRCALCRCRAKHDLHGFRVCDYHLNHGEDDRACPYCHTYLMFDPRWTYTTTGGPASKLVQRRQVELKDTIYLDDSSELVLSVESVMTHAPHSWPVNTRRTVVMVGVGLQLGTTFTITQWATDQEQALFNEITPTLSLARRVYTDGWTSVRALSGNGRSSRRHTVPWPMLNIYDKSVNVEPILRKQRIPRTKREHDIKPDHAERYWTVRQDQATRRERVWRHNFLNVQDLALRVFQVEWPA